MKYLSLEDVLFLHGEQLRLFGGAPGIRDYGLLEAALIRPQTGYYADLVEQAAALWESLTMNHAFVDGNKRVAFACLYVFVGLNGGLFDVDQDEAIDFIYRSLESSTFRKPVLEEWLRPRVKMAD